MVGWGSFELVANQPNQWQTNGQRKCKFWNHNTRRPLQGAHSFTAAKQLEITQLWEAIHPHRKWKLHRDRSPFTTVRRSRQPPHRKTVSNTTLYTYACRNTQTVTTEHKWSDFILAELDKAQLIQNRKQ